MPEKKSPPDFQSAKSTGFNFVHKNFKATNVAEFKVPVKKSSNASLQKDALPQPLVNNVPNFQFSKKRKYPSTKCSQSEDSNLLASTSDPSKSSKRLMLNQKLTYEQVIENVSSNLANKWPKMTISDK